MSTAKDSQQPITHVVAPNEEAQHAANDEKAMSLFQAIKLYPKAMGWSVVLSSALIMEGYDLALLGSLYGSPEFNKKYGVLNPDTGKYSVRASWQSALYVFASPFLYSYSQCQVQRCESRRGDWIDHQRLRQ